MRNTRKLITVLLVLTLLLALSAQALAAVAIDPAHPVSLTISYLQNGNPISGAPFSLYRVADVNAYTEFTLTGDFAGYPVKVDGLDSADWKALAETLTGYVQRDRLTPLDSGKTGSDGTLTFPTGTQTLLPGLYLVIGQRFSNGGYVYRTEPFLVCLPNLDTVTDTWQYDVTVSPKFIRTPVPVTPPEETDKRKVVKVWSDTGHEAERPKEIVIELLKDGTVYETVRLNAENNWRYNWDKLPKYDKSGDLIDWRVVEQTPDGYTVSVSQENGTFVVTNTSTRQPEKPSYEPTLPNTGALWWPVPVLLATGLLFVVSGVHAGRKRRHE